MSLVAILSGSSVGFAVLLMALGVIFVRRNLEFHDRVDRYLQGERVETPTVSELELSEPFFRRAILPIIRRIAQLFRWLLPTNRFNALRARVVMAGNLNGIGVGEFVGIKGVLTLLFAAIALAIGFYAGVKLDFFNGVLLLGIAALGFMLPDFWLGRRIRARQQAILNARPDAIDMLCIGTDAGLSLENAMREVTIKWNNELSLEFTRVLRELGMGVSRRDAFIALAGRTGISDVLQFVTAVNQSEELGVSIGRVLRTQADEVRTRRRQRAQTTANQAPVKMTIPLVFLIFPAIFVVLLGPAVIQLVDIFFRL